ncbi:MAG: hypothetical protein HC895_10610, partial [Leptolyngbyaceae cyanobacterium SM1_3_5]|nr:hypothetical protein [Leptolyngbyaceae cyanobacterium SM1_3_5]
VGVIGLPAKSHSCEISGKIAALTSRFVSVALAGAGSEIEAMASAKKIDRANKVFIIFKRLQETKKFTPPVTCQRAHLSN